MASNRCGIRSNSPKGSTVNAIVNACLRLVAQPTRPQSRSRRHSRITRNKLLIGAVLAIGIAAPIAGFLGEVDGQPMTSTEVQAPFLHGFRTSHTARHTEVSSLERATEWVNSPPLTSDALRGKVVLVQFWTYTCINWRRTLPYARAWADKYKDRGLVVIGVHSPEFEFEKNLSNVRQAATDMRVGYPIAVDNDHAVWQAFSNAYWPALYLVDAQGRIRHHQYGEGGYEKSERVIQQLLAEAGAAGVTRELVSGDAPGIEAA